MEWTRYIDGYCERTDPSYWAEPINAVTNAAFLIAAILMWGRTAGMPLGRALCVILAAIGTGSYLFHTHAQVWAAVADTTPIALFILTYLFAANAHYLRWPLWGALVGTAAFIPYVLITVPLFQSLPFFEISAGYWPVPLLIGTYAWLLRRRHPETARGLAIGTGILIASLVLRSIDEPLCATIPIGTHFWWHILNGIMLGWMIEVYRRHMLATRSAPV
ncbi:MAG: ceramidase domain-containing protein [Pseudomonadota bacterium]